MGANEVLDGLARLAEVVASQLAAKIREGEMTDALEDAKWLVNQLRVLEGAK